MAKNSGDQQVFRSNRVSPLGFWDIGFQDPAWPPVKPKSSPKVVGQNMKPGEGAQFGVVGQVLRSVSRQWSLSC